MTDGMPLSDRYFQVVDDIVQATLKGKIRSKEQVYRQLRQAVSPGTGELFDRCLAERLRTTQQQVDNAASELKQAKAMRSLRALNTISGEWERVQVQNRVSEAITTAAEEITTADPSERLAALVRAIDPNREQVLSLQQLGQLARQLQQQARGESDAERAGELQQLAAGIEAGLASWQRLENDVVSWIYDQSQGNLGFGGTPEQRGPWGAWAKRVESPLLQSLLRTLAQNRPLDEWLATQPTLPLKDWVELTLVLQYLQRGLVAWFDKRVYDSKMGAKLSISTFIAFAVIWSQLANTIQQAAALPGRDRFRNACFQVSLQILRAFAQRDYFPLYGGVYASLGGDSLRNALTYLDEPLRRVEGTQEKARILTLLGYSLQAQGQYRRAVSFHEQALNIAREAGDRSCEIANFNHLSRICVAQKMYAEAIDYSQRALMLARQVGNRIGQANALTNLGYSEVFQAQQQAGAEPEVYEQAIRYLEQGRQLLERTGDLSVGDRFASSQSQALCLSSLGIAHAVLRQPQTAVTYLQQGWQAAQASGDLYLQGLNLAYLAEAYFSLQDSEQAVYVGSLGAYFLEQIGSEDWRKPAGLLTILQGQLGREAFDKLLAQQRSKIIPFIGVDGYDYIPQLLQNYRDSI
jgi:tetratricopeptide (TPR) repeat protein